MKKIKQKVKSQVKIQCFEASATCSCELRRSREALRTLVSVIKMAQYTAIKFSLIISQLHQLSYKVVNILSDAKFLLEFLATKCFSR